MEIGRRQNLFYLLSIFSVTFIMSLGAWWLFLIFKLSTKYSHLNLKGSDANLINMIKWEGFTFVILLGILSVTLLYLYIQDSKKAKTLQVFFSSLTHELKTPLASMRLQAQVVEDQVASLGLPPEQLGKINKYINRLVEDNNRLENQLDNHLQLSRIEQNANLNIRPIPLEGFISNIFKSYDKAMTLSMDLQPDLEVLADDYALQTIFKNLFDNSIDHSSTDSVEVKIAWDVKNKCLHYTDNGKDFTGETEQLGKLFYKHNSPKGSGLGLYLIKSLTESMKGTFTIDIVNNILQFKIFMQVKENNE